MRVGPFDLCVIFNKPQLAFVLGLFSVSHFSESKGWANRSQEHYLDLHFLRLPCLLCLKLSTKVRTVLVDWNPAWRGAAQPSHMHAVPSSVQAETVLPWERRAEHCPLLPSCLPCSGLSYMLIWEKHTAGIRTLTVLLSQDQQFCTPVEN